MRIEPNAMCVADRQTGTSRLPHWSALRHDRPIADRIGREAADLHVAFVLHVAVGVDVPLDVVRIHAVGGQADGVLRDDPPLAVVLRHHAVADHAAGFADVQLLLPAAGLR